jgi:hypothetical protein
MRTILTGRLVTSFAFFAAMLLLPVSARATLYRFTLEGVVTGGILIQLG